MLNTKSCTICYFGHYLERSLLVLMLLEGYSQITGIYLAILRVVVVLFKVQNSCVQLSYLKTKEVLFNSVSTNEYR